MTITLVPFVWLAGLGLLASAAFHVSTLLEIPNLPGGIDNILHVNLGIVLLVTFAIGSRFQQEDGPKRIWSMFWRGCPLWMRRAIYLVLAYFVVVMLYGMVTTIGEPRVSTPQGVSGGFLLIYTVIFAVLYPASRLGINLYPAQCSHGHPMSALDMRCETCAQTPASHQE